MTWTGNTGSGTSSYRGYQRTHEVAVRGKPVVPASSDPEFLGDPARYNPEEMLVASLSSCHMLWYLHLCCVEGIVVEAYEDIAEGVMVEDGDGGGRFSQVILQPEITLKVGSDTARATTLHGDARDRQQPW